MAPVHKYTLDKTALIASNRAMAAVACIAKEVAT